MANDDLGFDFGAAADRIVKRDEQPKTDFDFGAAVDSIDSSAAAMSLKSAEGVNPDQAARARALAKRSGLPAPAVEGNEDAVESELNGAAARKALETSPMTRAFFGDPENAKLAHDDVESLGLFESIWRYGGNALKRGGLRVGQGGAQALAEGAATRSQDSARSFGEILDAVTLDKPTFNPIDVVHAAGRWLSSYMGGNDEAVAKERLAQVGELRKKIAAIPLSPAATKSRDAIMKAGKDGLLPAIEAAVSDPAGTLALGAEVGAEFVPQIAAATAVTAGARSPTAGAFALGGLSGLTERYVSPAEFLQKKGVDLSDPAQISMVLANPKLMRDAASFGFTRGMIIGSFDTVTGGLAGEAFGGPIRNMLTQMAIQMAGGGGGEAAAQYATEGKIDWGEVVLEAVGELATAPLDVVGVGGQYWQNTRAADRAKAAKEITDEAHKAAKASALNERAPDKAAEHRAAVLRAAGVDKIAIPADKLVEFAQSSADDPNEVMRALGVEDQVDDALALGGDVEVSSEAFAEHVMGQDAYVTLADHLRMEADGLTAAEAEEWQSHGLQDEIERIAAETEKEFGPEAAEIAQIQADVEAQLRAAGEASDTAQYGAALLAQRYATRAQRAGMSPLAMWQQDNVQVAGAQQAENVDNFTILLDKARSADPEKFLGLSKTPTLDALKAMGGVDPNGRFAAELKAAGVTAKTRPGLFKRGGIGATADDRQGDIVGGAAEKGVGEDNLTPSELPFLEAGEDGYIAPDDIVAAVRDELAGAPRRTPEQESDLAAFAGDVDQLNAILEAAGLSVNSPDADIRAAYEAATGRVYEQAGAPDSEAFRAWFGDSKVVDENGEPLVVYHGTGADFEAFDPARGGKASDSGWIGAGVYFSNRPDIASYYTNMAANISAPNVVPVYLSLQNPFIWGEKGMGVRGLVYDGVPLPAEIHDAVVERAGFKFDPDAAPDFSIEPRLSEAIRDVLIERGYDGVIASFNGVPGEFVAFRPEQIKSVHNRGAFNPADPRILYQAAPDEIAAEDIVTEYARGDITPAQARQKLKALGWGVGPDGFRKRYDSVELVADDGRTFRTYGQPNRGSIQFGADATVIRLGANADRSTFLHESGHLFLEQLRADAREFGGVNAQLVDDWNAVRDWWAGNAKPIRDEALAYARKANDEEAVAALAATTPDDVARMARSGDLTGGGVFAQAAPAEGLEFATSTESGFKKIEAFRAGSLVGQMWLDSRGRVADVKVSPAARRQGVATALYNRGGVSVATDNLSYDGFRFWRDRDPAQVAGSLYHFRDGLLGKKLDGKNAGTIVDVRNEYVSVKAENSNVRFPVYRNDLEAAGLISADPRILFQDGEPGADADAAAYIGRAMHEQWARGAEDYFRTGQAPSVALQDAFNRFRAWLVSIYAALKRRLGGEQLDVQFSPSVKAVMDRLLASDEEIALVEEQYDLKALFGSAEEIGMTPKQFADYQRAAARASEDARTRQVKKHLNEVERATLQWWKDEAAKVREGVAAEIHQRQEYRALYGITRGTLPDGSDIPGGLRPSRLNKAAVVSILENTESLARLPKVKGRAVYTTAKKEGGAHPDVIAHLYGYEDGREMLLAMMNAPDMRAEIEAETDRRMKAAHGDLLTSGATEAALESAHVDRRGDVLAMELHALRGSKDKMKPAFIRQWARERIGTRRIDDIQPQKFIAAERRAGREAGKALRAGDRLGAQRAKFRQLLNFYMAREAYKVREEIQKQRDYLAQFTNPRKKWGGVDADYVDQARGILEAYNLAPRLSDAKRDALMTWAAIEAENGAVLTIPPEVAAADGTKHYRDLTLDEWRTLHDTIKNIEAQGRLKKNGIIAGEQMAIETMAGDIVARLDTLKPNKRQARKAADQNPGAGDRALSKLAGFDAALRKVEFLLERMDGEKGGPAHKYIFQTFADAEAARNDLTKSVTRPIVSALDNLPKQVRKGLGEKVTVPLLGRKFRRSDLIMMALNVGNESNYQKMLEGSAKDVTDGAVPWTEEGIDEALAHLTAAEWDFVQTVWDAFESMYPQVREIYRRENGVAPERVEARSIETRHGQVLRGGYFPMMYDPSRSTYAQDIEGKSALEAMQSTAVKASVYSGMTKSRTGFSAPVLLDIEQLPRHIERTAHFVTHYEAVRTTRRLIQRGDVTKAIVGKMGREYYDTIKNWVGDLAANGQPVNPTSVAGRLVEAARTNATIAIMGLSYTTMASQLLGYANSVDGLARNGDGSYSPRKGALWLARGMAEYIRNPAQARRDVFAASGEMRHRLQNTDRDIRHGLRQLAGKKGAWRSFQRFSLMGIAGVQLYMVDMPTWLGAYNKAIGEGMTTTEAAKSADSVLRMSQTAGGTKDLAAIQRERGVTAGLTMFYSFFNLLYNLEAQAIGDVKAARDVPQLAARAFIVLMLPAALEALMRQKGPDDDKDEDWASWLGLKAAFYGLGSIPFLRDMVGMAEGFGYSVSPLDSFGKSLGQSVRGIAKAIDEGEMDVATIKAIIGAIGFGIGAPVTQVNRVVKAADQAFEGEDIGPYDYLVGPKK